VHADKAPRAAYVVPVLDGAVGLARWHRA
jgi:hypothetical protein